MIVMRVGMYNWVSEKNGRICSRIDFQNMMETKEVYRKLGSHPRISG